MKKGTEVPYYFLNDTFRMYHFYHLNYVSNFQTTEKTIAISQ